VPRFVPAVVIAELAALCKQYGIERVFGDKYALGFHAAEWRTHGIEFVPCENTTSQNYLQLLPLLLAGRVRLLDNKTLRNQLVALERKPGDGAREQVSHPQTDAAHDDVSAAVAGAIVAATSTSDGYDVQTLMLACDMVDPGTAAQHELQRLLARGEPRPLSGPLAIGSQSLGFGGYRVAGFNEPECWENARAAAEANAGQRARNVPPPIQRTETIK
jgi:hypothetical protein